jgi:Flp pilus assembly protein CpaB
MGSQSIDIVKAEKPVSQGVISQPGSAYRQRLSGMGTSLTAGLQRKGVRIPEFAIGLLIVCICIIGAFMWQNSDATGTKVLVTSRALQRGHEIQASDLSSITLTSSDDIALLETSTASDIIGMRITTDIVAGTPLTPSQLISVRPLTTTEGLAGITVTKAQAPANLAAGDNVQVIAVDSQSDGTNLTTSIVAKIQVWEISDPDELSGDRSVTLRIAITSANELIGHDELHLVKVVN